MSRWLSSPPNVVSLGVIALIAANYFGAFADLDWCWQIRTGGQIVANGSLHVTDTFTYTIAGQRLPDFEWLYEVILWSVWEVLGMGGLKFLRVLLVFMPLVLVALQLRREGIRPHGVALALGVAIIVLSPAWNLRPLFCTTIGLLLVSSWLHDHCLGRRQLTWWLPFVMLLWANLHPGVITGQGLLLGAIGWEWLNQWLRWNPALDRTALNRLTLIGGLGFLASFVCPDPIERLRYTVNPDLAHPIMRIFVEMQPTYVLLTKEPFPIGLVYAVAALVLLTVVLRGRHYRGWEIALLAGVTFLGNYAFRSLQDWLLIMLAVGAPHIRDLFVEAAQCNWRRWWVRGLLKVDSFAKRLTNSPLFRWQPSWPAVVVAGLLILSLIPPVARSMPIQESPEWPVAALDYIEQAGLMGRFFAPPDYGAYLTWRLGERVQVYADTRGFFFPPRVLEDSVYIPQMGPDWRQRLLRVLDVHQTDYFLLETQLSRGTLWRTLAPYIDRPLLVNDAAVLLHAEQVRAALIQHDLSIRSGDASAKR